MMDMRVLVRRLTGQNDRNATDWWNFDQFLEEQLKAKRTKRSPLTPLICP